MDRFLRSSKLEVIPEEPDVAKVFFDHWGRTFDTILETISAAVENADNANKRVFFANYLAQKTYFFIVDATTR